MQKRGRTPPFFELKRASQCLPGQVKSAALVAKNITPATRTCRLHFRVSTEGDRPRTGNDDDPGLASRPTQERDLGIMCQLVAVAGNQFLGVGFIVFRAAA